MRLAFLLVLLPAAMRALEIKVCYYTSFIPVSYRDASTGKASGFEPDLLRAMSVYGGFNLSFIPMESYDPIWKLPAMHHCDLAAGGISVTPEREADGVEFTDPHWTIAMPQSLLVLRDTYEAGFRGYEDIRPGQKLGVVHGTTGKLRCLDRVREAGLDPEVVVVDYEEEQALLAALRRGDIVGIARGEPGNRFQESLNPDLYRVTALRSFNEQFSFAIPYGSPSLRLVLNDALQKVTDSKHFTYVDWVQDHTVFDRAASTFVFAKR